MSPKLTQLIQQAMQRGVDERTRLLEEAYKIFEGVIDKNSLSAHISDRHDNNRFNEDPDKLSDTN